MTGSDKAKSESKVEQMFISNDGEKTFEFEDNLPSLPVPPLKSTLERYLESGKFKTKWSLNYSFILQVVISFYPIDHISNLDL